MCFLRKYIKKEVKRIMAELTGQLTPFEVDVYLDNKIKGIDVRVGQLETNAGTNVDGVKFLELKSITTQPATSVENDLYYNSLDEKIYKKGITTWGTTNVGENGIIYKYENKYYKYDSYDKLSKIGQKAVGYDTLYVDNLSSNNNDFNHLTVENQIIANSGVDVKSHKIINVQNPTANQDVATKKYVDDLIKPEIVFTGDYPLPCTAEVISFPFEKFNGILFSYQLTFKDGGNDVTITDIFTMNNNEIKFTFSYYSIAKSAIVVFESFLRADTEDIKLYNTELTTLSPTITVPIITIKRLIK